MSATKILSIRYVNSSFSTTSTALFLSNAIINSDFLSKIFFKHSLLYLEIFKGKLFYQIDETITEGFFAVYFILTATFFSLL